MVHVGPYLIGTWFWVGVGALIPQTNKDFQGVLNSPLQYDSKPYIYYSQITMLLARRLIVVSCPDPHLPPEVERWPQKKARVYLDSPCTLY